MVGLICNEEGKLLGLDYNRALRDEENKIYDIDKDEINELLHNKYNNLPFFEKTYVIPIENKTGIIAFAINFASALYCVIITAIIPTIGLSTDIVIVNFTIGR